MTDTAITISNVEKIYGSGSRAVTALQDISLEIGDQEFFTLLGPSGCGKTTLLRLIAGFEQPNRGEILLFGSHLEGLEPNERPVNTVFQHYSLFPHMTIAENIGFGLRMQGRESSEIEKVVANMLALVKMEEYGERTPKQLSGGQQQRIALARALAPQPKVLLLDEPLSALDLKLRQAMRQELKQLQKETGITFVFVTHDQEEAMTMSDRIAVMSQGKIQQLGSPEAIYESPNNRFVANFIGDVNLIDATVKSITDSSIICGYGKMEISARLRPEMAQPEPGQTVTLALRPEKLSFCNPGQGVVDALVTEGMYMGTDRLYSVDIGDSLSLQLRTQNSEQDVRPAASGDQVGLHLAPNTAVILND